MVLLAKAGAGLGADHFVESSEESEGLREWA